MSKVFHISVVRRFFFNVNARNKILMVISTPFVTVDPKISEELDASSPWESVSLLSRAQAALEQLAALQTSASRLLVLHSETRGSLTSGALIHDKYGPRHRFLELLSLFEAFISDLCYSLSQQYFKIDKKSTILHQHLLAFFAGASLILKFVALSHHASRQFKASVQIGTVMQCSGRKKRGLFSTMYPGRTEKARAFFHHVPRADGISAGFSTLSTMYPGRTEKGLLFTWRLSHRFALAQQLFFDFSL